MRRRRAIHFSPFSSLLRLSRRVYSHSIMAKGDGPGTSNRIRAKGYTDNVVDLMVGKLNRLPVDTQEALQQLACLGHSAAITTLALVHGTSEEEVHAHLWEAVRHEVIERLESAYRFIHDRVQEAAYALIPEEATRRSASPHRAAARSTYASREAGRGDLRARQSAQPWRRADHCTQRNASSWQNSTSLPARAPRIQRPTPRRSPISSRVRHCWRRMAGSASMRSRSRWSCHRAECELLDRRAGRPRRSVLTALAARAADDGPASGRRVPACGSVHDARVRAAARSPSASTTSGTWASTGRPHPTERGSCVANTSGSGPSSEAAAIEDLVDLPPMQDPEPSRRSTCSPRLGPPTLYTDENLYALSICRAVNLSLERGNGDGAPTHYVAVGLMVGDRFGDYDAGYRLGKMACDLTERRGLKRFGGKTYAVFALVVPWTRPLREGIDPARRAFQMANEQGDRTFAAYACWNLISTLLASGDPLPITSNAKPSMDSSSRAQCGSNSPST